MERDAKMMEPQRQCEIHPVWRIQKRRLRPNPGNGCPQNTYGFHKGTRLGRVALRRRGAVTIDVGYIGRCARKYNGVVRKQYIAKHAEGQEAARRRPDPESGPGGLTFLIQRTQNGSKGCSPFHN